MLTAPERIRTSTARPTHPSTAQPTASAPPAAAPEAPASACDSVRRLVAAALDSAEHPYLPWLASASLGQLQDAVALAAAQLDHERWALACIVSPELVANLPGPSEMDRTLRALAVPLTVEDLTAHLPEPAARRRRTLTMLVEDRSLRGVALGWLTASQVLLAAGRFPSADAIRAHGFGADTAQAWESLFEPGAAMPSLEVTEAVLHEHPHLAPMAFAGAELAIRTATAVEHHLTTAWHEGRRAVRWPGPLASETPGVIDPA